MSDTEVNKESENPDDKTEVRPDAAKTDHPTGEKQAQENAETESPA